jgi:hypothetical protein
VSQQTGENCARRLHHLLQRNRYSHRVPPIEIVEADQLHNKVLFDFSEDIDRAVNYHEFLSSFMNSRDQFIHDVLLLDASSHFDLSALIHIDGDLAVFELKVPRIPPKISVANNFVFSYVVWHLSHEAEDTLR